MCIQIVRFYYTTKQWKCQDIDENGFHVTGHNYGYKDDGGGSFFELVKARGYREKVETFAEENGRRVGLNRMQ